VVWRGGGILELKEELVGVAPVPSFAGLEGADDGVLGGLVVLGGVPVPRVVAAADMAACRAHPQMHPPIPRSQAFHTAVTRRRHILDLIKMAAAAYHA
jgi:hypothetical protein